MEAIPARDSNLVLRRPRRPFGNWLVVAIYALMVLSAPFALRYAPDPEASVIGTTTSAPRCATAPEFGYSCKPAERAAK